MLTAFGEVKTLSAWARDARNTSRLTIEGLVGRLERGYTLERALTEPKWKGKVFTINGVEKNIHEWSQSPQNVHGLAERTIANRVHTQGYTIEEALSTPSGYGTFVYQGERKSLKKWAQDPRCRADYDTLRIRIYTLKKDFEWALTTPIRSPEQVAIFGEIKTIHRWSKDPRCVVSHPTLRDRIRGGINPEIALTSRKIPLTRLAVQV